MRELADFIEEDGAALGKFKPAEASLQRAGEGSLLVTEQLRCNQRCGDGRTVHIDKGSGGALGPFVDGTSDEFLAGAGFTGYENTGIGGRDLADSCKHGLQGRRVPHDFLEHGHFVDFIAKSEVLISGPVFRPFAIIDIGRSRIPANDLAVFVQ